MSDPLVRQDLLDLQELLVHLALQARGVSLGIGDHQDNRVLLGNQAHREMPVLKDQQVHKAQKVQLDRKALQVWLGLLVHQAQLGNKAQKDYSEIREIRVNLVHLGPLDHQDLLEHEETLAHLVHRVLLDNRVLLDLLDPLDLKVPLEI